MDELIGWFFESIANSIKRAAERQAAQSRAMRGEPPRIAPPQPTPSRPTAPAATATVRQSPPPSVPPASQAPAPAVAERALVASLFSNPRSLAAAFIASEVLGKPVTLRDR